MRTLLSMVLFFSLLFPKAGFALSEAEMDQCLKAKYENPIASPFVKNVALLAGLQSAGVLPTERYVTAVVKASETCDEAELVIKLMADGAKANYEF